MDLSAISVFLGGFILVFVLCSSLLKNKWYLSEAPIAVAFGILLGPVCGNFISFETEQQQENFTLGLSRLVIDIQVLLVGLELPGQYVWDRWKPMLVVLVAGMSLMWVVSAGLVVALVPGLDFLAALMVGSCFTPTDPVLSSAILKGPFAENEDNVKYYIRNLISAESAANDGLGYPFLYLAIYYMKLSGGPGIKEWVVQAVLRAVLLSVAIGAAVGTGIRLLIKKYYHLTMIDKEWYGLLGLAMALLLLGGVSLSMSDDLLACFAAGVAISWEQPREPNSSTDGAPHNASEDASQNDTQDASQNASQNTPHDALKKALKNTTEFLQVLEPFLNVIMFTFIGATMPWQAFADLGLWQLFVLAILVLLLRRVPPILLLYGLMLVINNSKEELVIKNLKEALFTGWFGPIGVGAIFYYAVAVGEFDATGPFASARAALLPVVYFNVLASVVVHGFSIPVWVGGHHAWKWVADGAQKICRECCGLEQQPGSEQHPDSDEEKQIPAGGSGGTTSSDSTQ